MGIHEPWRFGESEVPLAAGIPSCSSAPGNWDGSGTRGASQGG